MCFHGSPGSVAMVVSTLGELEALQQPSATAAKLVISVMNDRSYCYCTYFFLVH